jgi:hypothetical protein
MFEDLVNQFHTMSLGQELYTICFTAFMLGGGWCCFLHTDAPDALQAPTPKPRAKPRCKRSNRRKPAPLATAAPAMRRSVRPRLRAMPPQPRSHAAA